MELTVKQEEGLKIAVQRYKDHEKYTCISGYAGSGKSTLVRFIIESIGVPNEDVAYIAFTGKASLVLREKGCPNAITAHKLLYKSFPRADGTFAHMPRRQLEHDYKIIVVDEVSMLPKDMWELLISHNIYVIAMGDPGQLPPIGEENGVLSQPHVFLDEVMRQAQDSEIIRLSMNIRNGKRLIPFKGTEINIVPHNGLTDGMLDWADQVICGKNATRRYINDYCRTKKWGERKEEGPLIGDKLICLHNNWDVLSSENEPLVNGTIGTLSDVKHLSYHPLLGKDLKIDFSPDYSTTDLFCGVRADWKLLTAGEPTINRDNFRQFPKQIRPEQFDYGYAITCHKSQGSEFEKVLVLEEVLKSTEHQRWLYTAVTRASKKLTLILK